MNRRKFAQRLALGAGGLGISLADFWPLASSRADEVPQPGAAGEKNPDEPVKVADFQTLAAAKLPKATFDYITTGSADEITLRENVADDHAGLQVCTASNLFVVFGVEWFVEERG